MSELQKDSDHLKEEYKKTKTELRFYQFLKWVCDDLLIDKTKKALYGRRGNKT